MVLASSVSEGHVSIALITSVFLYY